MCDWPVWLSDLNFKKMTDLWQLKNKQRLRSLNEAAQRRTKELQKSVVKKILVNGIFSGYGAMFSNRGKRNHYVRACKWQGENQKENRALRQSEQ